MNNLLLKPCHILPWLVFSFVTKCKLYFVTTCFIVLSLKVCYILSPHALVLSLKMCYFLPLQILILSLSCHNINIYCHFSNMILPLDPISLYIAMMIEVRTWNRHQYKKNTMFITKTLIPQNQHLTSQQNYIQHKSNISKVYPQ